MGVTAGVERIAPALALLCSAIAVTGCTHAASSRTVAVASRAPLEARLIARADARLNAYATGDKAPWERDLDPHALLMDEEGHVSTAAGFLAALRPLPKGSTGTLHVTHPRFRRIGDVAVLAYVVDEHETIFRARFHAHFGIVDTYHRAGNRWLLVADQQTRLPHDPPTVPIDRAQMRRYVGRYRMVGGPVTFVVTIAHGVLVGGVGPARRPLRAIADQPNTFFREHMPGVLIFVPGKSGLATTLVDRVYYNRDRTYRRIALPK